MQNTGKQLSLFQEIENRYQAEKKLLKKKKFRLKAKLMLTVILPVFIVLLAIKVIQTFIHIKVREIFAKPVDETAVKPVAGPVPAQKTPVKKEYITPEKV